MRYRGIPLTVTVSCYDLYQIFPWDRIEQNASANLGFRKSLPRSSVIVITRSGEIGRCECYRVVIRGRSGG